MGQQSINTDSVIGKAYRFHLSLCIKSPRIKVEKITSMVLGLPITLLKGLEYSLQWNQGSSYAVVHMLCSGADSKMWQKVSGTKSKQMYCHEL